MPWLGPLPVAEGEGRDPCDGGTGIPAHSGRGPHGGMLTAPDGAGRRADLGDELLNRNGSKPRERAVLRHPDRAG
jgi:hypothetical protein